jgi:hypothetical protein
MPRDGSAPTQKVERRETMHAQLAEQDDLARSPSPVDLPAPPAPLPHGLKWTIVTIAWASLVLTLLNAHAIRAWSYQLPPGAASARIVTAAETWYATVDQAGLNRPVETLHGWWQSAKDARFQGDGEAAADRPQRPSGARAARQ